MKPPCFVFLALSLIAALTLRPALAQESGDLAKAAQNPISDPIPSSSGIRQIGQIRRFGSQPVNLQASFYYNVERPDFAPEYQLRLQLQLMFPK